MKLLLLLENTQCNDEFLYSKALLEVLAKDGYEVSLVFISGGTPSDHTYQLVKQYVVHRFTKLCFRSLDDDYVQRLAAHIDKHEYDAIITYQAVFPGVTVAGVYELIEHKPKLVFVGSKCSDTTTQAAAQVAHLSPTWGAFSELVAKNFMAAYDAQVVYGPAVEPEALGVDVRAEFGIRKDARLVGYIGDVDNVNIEPVIEACKRMECGLLIAGTGSRITQLSAVKGNLRVVPTIPQYRADWYHAIDCFIYPVRNAGFPMLPLEAAMCNCPVAMTPVSDMANQLGNEFGFFVWDPVKIIEAVRKAVGSDNDHTRQVVAEMFSRERFLTSWHLLLRENP